MQSTPVWVRALYNEMNVTLTFLKTVTLGDKPEIQLAASSLYRIFVNGELIGYGPARAAHGFSRIDRYSLAKWAGETVVIAVDVHSAQVNSFYVVDEKPFFMADILDGTRVIATAEDFTAYPRTDRLQKVRRFSFQRTFMESYRMHTDPYSLYRGDTTGFAAAQTTTVPANELLPRHVHYPTLETVPYAALVEHGKVGIDADARLWQDRSYLGIDDVKFKGYAPEELEEDAGEEVSRMTYRRDGENALSLVGPAYQIFDFSRTVTGFFSLDVTVKKAAVVYILFDELTFARDGGTIVDPFRNTCCNVLKYTLAPGRYRLLSMEANTARYANVVTTAGEVAIHAFGMVSYENPDAKRFQYDYHDAELNKIVAAAVNTFAQNAVDVLTDCPSRERAGWLCDSYFSSRAEALFTGESRVERNFLENYAMCPQSPFLPAGMIPMCYPSDHNDGVYIPNWTMWYILELRNYVNRTGDNEMAVLSRDKVYGLVEFFDRYVNADGLLENLESWVFIEWSRCNDKDFIAGVNYPSNMLWAAALDAAADLYNDAALRERAAKMRAVIREQSWNGTFFEDNAIRGENGELQKAGHTSETCQYYAFYFGVASRDTDPALFETMLTKFGPKRDDTVVYPTVYRSNAIVGNYLRLELLMNYGYRAEVLSECRDFFTRMAEMTGTLWEHSQLSCSLNHGFASMAAVYIDRCAK